jgi:hypothetical protein
VEHVKAKAERNQATELLEKLCAACDEHRKQSLISIRE